MDTSEHALGIAAAVTLGLASAATAGAPAVPITSSFDTGFDGWTANVAGEVTWSSTGGNPGGYVHFVDASGSGTRIIAPASYLGDWTSLDDVGSLTYDHEIITPSGQQHAQYQATISGPGGSAQWAGAVPTVVGQWVTISVPIVDSHWCVQSGTWADILAEVTELTVEIELVFGVPDVEGIDNVVLDDEGAFTCPADIDYDGAVAVTDLLALLAAWGPAWCGPPDLDGDGAVSVVDLLALLAAWGRCP